MPGPEMDIKRELFEAGNRLLKPPDSVDELLALLDRVEHCLTFVEQQPPVEMQDALCPAFKSLITKELIQHPDTDVRVGVTACLTEISRITAPDVPYNDELMKEVFRLTISAFEGLEDNSSKSFGKRASILEMVARVRSCAVLLDLECDGLIVDMFQNFYKCIRGFHTANVFASMESIMTLVIEESEEISNDLLFTLLSVLKKENENASPIARKLGEKVVRNCATRLKASIVDAIKSLKINLLDYDFVVTLACQMTPDHNPLGASSSNGSESNLKDVDEATQEVVAEATPGSTMHRPSNFTVEAAEVAAQTLLEALGASRKPDSNVVVRPTETIQDNAEVGQDTPRSESVLRSELLCLSKSELRSEKIAKKRGRKPKNAVDIMHSDSGKLRRRDGKKGPSELPVSKVIVVTEASEVSPEESSAPDASEKKSDSSNQVVSPIGPVNNAVTIESPSMSESHGKSSRERVKRSKKPESTQEATSSRQATERKASTGSDHTETGSVSSEKDAASGGARDASKSITLVEVKKEPDIEGDSEDNPLRRSDAQLGVTDGTPRTKKRGRPRKDATISTPTGAKDGVSSEGVPKKRSRRRFIAPEDGKEYAEELVGSRIKVWWPQDKVYYDGIIESFDPIRRKHKILYTDNEREVLNLHKEKWKLVKSREGSEKGGATGHSNTRDASDTQAVKKMKTGSSLAGVSGNTDSPLKKRRGRPPKNAVTLAGYDTAAKISQPEGKTKADEANIDSTADAGNPVKSTDTVAERSGLPNLNAEIETSEHDVPENFETQAKKDSTVGTSVMDTVAPKAAVGLDINETFTLGSDEQPDENETAAATATPNRGISDVNVIEEGKAVPPPGLKTEGVDQKMSAFGTEIKRRKRKASSASPAVSGSTEIKHRKRKARTTFGSVSPAVPGGVDVSTKRRRGRPPAKLTPDGESKDLGKQLGERRSLGHSDNGVVVKSEDFPIEVRNVPFMSAPIKVSEHDPNATKSTPDSVRFATKEGVGLAVENSSKSSTGEMKIGSPTILKVKFKNLDPEPKPRRRRARKDSTSPPQLNKDGSIRKPRGRPCKPKVEATKSEGGSNSSVAVHARKADDDFAFAVKSETRILHKGQASLAKDSGVISENDAPNMGGSAVPKDHTPAGAGLSDKQIARNDDDSTPLSKLGAMGTGDLNLGLAMETKGEDGASQKSPKSRTSKDSSATMSSSYSSKEELHGEEAAALEGEEGGKRRRKRSKKPVGGGEAFFS
uniref:Uncharacterized protein n=1 Tax=Kalanchoe fedtschenkoi TaxID=63787 RepID=A0A7N1A4M3_KALFE